MSLDVLVAPPPHQKLFMDLVASCYFAKTHHASLTVDILLDKSVVPAWWQAPSWIRMISSLETAKPHYQLVIQTKPDVDLAVSLKALKADHRSGVVGDGGTTVHGRWAQTLLAQLGCAKFAPFSPFDLNAHVLLGHPVSYTTPQLNKSDGQWIIDLDSLPRDWRTWGEDLLKQCGFAHPQRALDQLPSPLEPERVAAYIGCNATLATWLAFQGAHVVLLFEGEFDALNVLAASHPTYQPLRPGLTPGQVLALPRAADVTGDAFRYTPEYLGGLCRTLTDEKWDDSNGVFALLHYVVINYLNDLREVDLPIPQVTANCCLRLKGIQAVFAKLVHLNQFGIKYIQEFLDRVNSAEVTETDVQEIGQRITEIDDLTERTMAAYPELDVYRLMLKFAKSAAAGDNMVEIAKSLILIFHESSQALGAYSELMDAIVKQHARPEGRAGT